MIAGWSNQKAENRPCPCPTTVHSKPHPTTGRSTNQARPSTVAGPISGSIRCATSTCRETSGSRSRPIAGAGPTGFCDHDPEHIVAQPMRGFEPPLPEHRRLHRPHHPPDLGREGHRLHLRHLQPRLPGLGRRGPAVRPRKDRGRHGAHQQRDARHPAGRRRGDLGRRRGRELPYLAPHHDPRHQHRLQPFRAADRPADPPALRRQLRVARQRDPRRARRL